MTPSLVIGLDIGTSGCKGVAVDRRGRIAAAASGSYRLYSPRVGWAEQDVNEVWRAAAGALAKVVGQVARGRIDGVCLSGAMHSLVPVDAHGTVRMRWAAASTGRCSTIAQARKRARRRW